MGYRSYYTMNVMNVTPEEEAIHVEAVQEEFDENFDEETKWYDSDENMKDYSTRYPDLVFCIHREGEESDDLSDTYFKNGKMQECPAQIIYPPYDETKLV